MLTDLFAVNMLILWTLFGALGAYIGVSKGHAAAGGCIWGMLLGPIGWIIVAFVGNAGKKCPRCAEHVKREAEMCRYCGWLFTSRAAAARPAPAPGASTPPDPAEPQRWGKLPGS